MIAGDLERLIQLLARLPGLGPRSARRAVLHLMKKREALMLPLAEAMARAAETVTLCSTCGNLDTRDPCGICRDPSRDARLLCVVEDVADLWALERSGAFKGRYHVLGGTLSAIDGRGPEQLNMGRLVARATARGTGAPGTSAPGTSAGGSDVEEVILALSATVDGQTTAHYISERLAGGGAAGSGVKVSRLAHGVPVGGELDYLDDGTLTAALKARRPA
jgi:recombination protein RecR